MIFPVVEEGSPEGAEPVDWTESLRERKKRLTRSLISETATALFLERGFDEVRVTEVAEACGVSEKTVYNYFPTKESLLFDREPEMAAELWRALGPGSAVHSPVAGVLGVLAAERTEMRSAWDVDAREFLRRFSGLIETTPAVQTAMRDMWDRLEDTAAEALAERSGVSPDQPEPRIAASALIGLWRIQSDSLRRCATEGRDAAGTDEVVAAEVERAARVVESGLWWFGAAGDGRPSRQQLKVAADAAVTAGRQIVGALRQARTAWEQMQHEGAGQDEVGDFSFPALASFLEETERWKRDMLGQKDEWKRAYREEQVRLRKAQRELAQHYREQAQRSARGRRRGP